MKTTITLILTVISRISIPVFGIWSIVEFCLYLFKDKTFNWTCVYFFIGSVILTIILAIATLLFASTEKPKVEKRIKSNFERRLDQMAEERKQKQNN